MSMPTCTITIAADGGTCGQQAVTSFTSRDGHRYHECIEHSVVARGIASPTPRNHPPTRSKAPLLLVKDDRIVGYAHLWVTADARARKLGARVVQNGGVR